MQTFPAKKKHAATILHIAVLVLLLAISGLNASAQESQIINFDHITYAAFDGDKIYQSNYTTDGTNVEFTIFDENFSVIKSFTLKDVNVHLTYLQQMDTEDMLVSRGLFTNDGKWCVIVKAENKDLYVHNEDGAVVCKLPVNYAMNNSYEEDGYIWLSNITYGKPYYVTCKRENSNREYTVWSFVDSSTGVTPQAIKKVAAYPNPLPSGAALTITLPQEADDHTIVTIADMNGRQVLRRTVDNFATEVKISPRFGQGTYIYTIIYSDGTSLSGKVAAE